MANFLWNIHLCGVLFLLGFMKVTASELRDFSDAGKQLDDASEDADEETCPTGTEKIHRGCYMFVSAPDTWDDAFNYCKTNNGELLSIQSQKEKEGFESYLKQSEFTETEWWVGLKRDSEGGADWRWLDGEPVSRITPWKSAQKITVPGKYCGFMDITDQGIKVDVHRCSRQKGFICEFHLITKRPNTVSTTPLNVIRGATITDDLEITGNPGNGADDGSIVGVSKPHGHKTNVTGGLYSSMMTVLSNSDLHTSPQIASIQNTTIRDPSMGKLLSTTVKPIFAKTGPPVIDTDPSSGRGDVKDTSGLEREKTLEAGVKAMPSATENYNIRTLQPLVTFIMGQNTSIQRFQSESPTSQPPTEPSWTRPDTPEPTMVDWVKAYKEFEGCYIPGTGGSLRHSVNTARRFYNQNITSCPEVHIGSIRWPSIQAGHTANVSCAKGHGVATFLCGHTPICWASEPNIAGCASKKLQAVLKKSKHPSTGQSVAPTLEETVELSTMLIQAIQTEQPTMEDIIVTSQVITSLSQIKDTHAGKDNKQVENIIENVIKVGNILVSTNKPTVWEGMSQKDKVRSASMLLVAIETATVSLAQTINEPTVMIKKDGNIGLELRVVDLKTLENKELVYDSGLSENSFSIPFETAKSFSEGGFVKAVFITHYSMSQILSGYSKQRNAPTTLQPNKTVSNNTNSLDNKTDMAKNVTSENDDNFEEETGPMIASHILSASLGGNRLSTDKLPKPVSFTMKHTEEVDPKYLPLCSFWDNRQETQLGYWSQDGCSMVHTNKSHTTCKCEHMTNFAILLDVHGMEVSKVHQSLLGLVTIIGCLISSISLLASWITFQCFASLQGERNSIHKNLAFTLLIAEVLFVFGIDQAKYQIACYTIAGLLHFFFLAAFTWMFIEGLHIIFMLVQVFDASRSRLPYYYTAGYGVPLVVIGVSCIFFYEGYGTDKYCWLTTERYFIWAFAGPVAIILLVNAVFLTYAMSTVCRHSDYVFNSKEKSSTSGIRSWVQGALALEVLLGLTWTLGYFIINDDSIVLAYAFAILNSLQGLFIFIFHCLLNKKAQKEYRQVVRKVVRRSPSSITTQSTFTKRTNHTNNSHELNNSPSNSHQKLNTANSHSLA